MGSTRYTMSFGKAASAGAIAGAALLTSGVCLIQHQSVLTSGLQPSTVSLEWQAATVKYMLNRPLEADPDGKKFVNDPIRNTMPEAETGRSNKWSTTRDLKNP